jgi:hypothetical protein
MNKLEGDINRHEKDICKIKSELLKLKPDFHPEIIIVSINPPLGPSDDQEQVARHLVQKQAGHVSTIKQMTTARGKHTVFLQDLLPQVFKTVDNRILPSSM